jgi:TPR repeat protein
MFLLRWLSILGASDRPGHEDDHSKEEEKVGKGRDTKYQVAAEADRCTNGAVNGGKGKAQGIEFLQAADEAYQNNDHMEVIRCLESAAECGNRDAKFELGTMILGTDFQKAYRLFLEAAQDGDAKAAHNLGVMFRDGMDIKQDDERAFYWFERGAQLGSARSMNSLGKRYENGQGVARDLKRAHELYTEADQQGDPDAGFNLATMYILGLGVKQDESNGIHWLQRSASHGNRIAAEALRDPTKYICDYVASHLQVR